MKGGMTSQNACNRTWSFSTRDGEKTPVMFISYNPPPSFFCRWGGVVPQHRPKSGGRVSRLSACSLAAMSVFSVESRRQEGRVDNIPRRHAETPTPNALRTPTAGRCCLLFSRSLYARITAESAGCAWRPLTTIASSSAPASARGITAASGGEEASKEALSSCCCRCCGCRCSSKRACF